MVGFSPQPQATASADPWAAFPFAQDQPQTATGNDPWAAFPFVSDDQKDAQERVKSEAGTLQNIDNAARSVARGVPLVGGAMDEISAGLNTGFGYASDYGKELAYQRERDRQYDEQHPILSHVGQFTGGILGTIAGARALPFNPVPATLPGKIAAGAGLGSAVGGEEAFTRGEGGFQNRAQAAKTGAVVGGLIGGAVPPVASTIGGAWNGIAGVLAKRGTDARAINKIIGELQASGMTPQQATQRLSQLGPQGMLADVAPGMQTMTAGTAVSDTGAGNTIAQRLATRREGGGARVAQDLDQAFGPPADRFLVEQANKAEKDLLAPVYAAARGRGVVVTPVVSTINQVAQRFPQAGSAADALRSVRSMLNDSNTGRFINSAGNLIGVRQEMDRLVRLEGNGSFAAGMKTPVGAALAPVRDTLNLVLHQNKGLKEADQAYQAASRQMEAFTMGRRDLLRGGSETMTPAQVQMWKAQNRGNVGAAAQGVRSEMDRVLSNERMNPGIATDRMLSRDRNKDKVGALIGSSRIPPLENAIDREATFRDTGSLSEPSLGSRTAIIENAKRIWGTQGARSSMGDLAGATLGGLALGGPWGALGGAVGAGANMMRQRLASALTKTSQDVIRQAADKLTATGAARDQMMNDLGAAVAKIPKAAQTRDRIQRLATVLMATQGAREAGIQAQPSAAGR